MLGTLRSYWHRVHGLLFTVVGGIDQVGHETSR